MAFKKCKFCGKEINSEFNYYERYGCCDDCGASDSKKCIKCGTPEQYDKNRGRYALGTMVSLSDGLCVNCSALAMYPGLRREDLM